MGEQMETQNNSSSGKRKIGPYKIQLFAALILGIVSLGVGLTLITSGTTKAHAFWGIAVLLVGTFLSIALLADRGVHISFGDDAVSYRRHKQVKRGVAYKRYSRKGLKVSVPFFLWLIGGFIVLFYPVAFQKDYNAGLLAACFVIYIAGDIIGLNFLFKATTLKWECPRCGNNICSER